MDEKHRDSDRDDDDDGILLNTYCRVTNSNIPTLRNPLLKRQFVWTQLQTIPTNLKKTMLVEMCAFSTKCRSIQTLHYVFVNLYSAVHTTSDISHMYEQITPLGWFHIRQFIVWRLGIEFLALKTDIENGRIRSRVQWELWLDTALKLCVSPYRVQNTKHMRMPTRVVNSIVGVSRLSYNLNNEFYVTLLSDKTGRSTILPTCLGVGAPISTVLKWFFFLTKSDTVRHTVFTFRNDVSKVIKEFVQQLFADSVLGEALFKKQHHFRMMVVNTTGYKTYFERTKLKMVGIITRDDVKTLEKNYSHWSRLGTYAHSRPLNDADLFTIQKPNLHNNVEMENWITTQYGFKSRDDVNRSVCKENDYYRFIVCASCGSPHGTLFHDKVGLSGILQTYVMCHNTKPESSTVCTHGEQVRGVRTTNFLDITRGRNIDETYRHYFYYERPPRSVVEPPPPPPLAPVVVPDLPPAEERFEYNRNMLYIGIDASPLCISICVLSYNGDGERTPNMFQDFNVSYHCIFPHTEHIVPHNFSASVEYTMVSQDSNMIDTCCNTLTTITNEQEYIMFLEESPPPSLRRDSNQLRFVRMLYTDMKCIFKNNLYTVGPTLARQHFAVQNLENVLHDYIHPDWNVDDITWAHHHYEKVYKHTKKKHTDIKYAVLYLYFLRFPRTHRIEVHDSKGLQYYKNIHTENENIQLRTMVHPYFDLIDSFVMAYHSWRYSTYVNGI